MSSNLRTAGGIHRWVVGVGLASGAAVAAAVIGTGAAATARADDTNLLDVLNQATANFTAAEQVFGGVPATDLPNLVLNQVQDDDTALTYLGLSDTNRILLDSENSISSYDNGEFSTLVTPSFTDLDQNWLQASEAALNADTALDTAITSGVGLNAAELGVIVPDLQVMGDGYFSGIIDQSAYLLSMF
jgi:hypothetical protein